MAAASSSSAAISPPSGKTGILRPGSKHGDQQMKQGQISFERAVNDMFAYLGKEDEQNVPDHRKIKLVNPTRYLPFFVGENLEIVTSAQAPKRSEIGEQGIPMRVKLADGEYYWAKITTVDSRVGKEGQYALASFREVMVNLSLFGSGVQGVAPMYNWFFTSVDPPSEHFIDQFASTWHSLVFSTFYAPGMKEDFGVYFETMRAKLKGNRKEIDELSKKETKIKEKLAMPEKNAQMLQYLKEAYEHHFKGKKWHHSAMRKSKRALVLISKSAGAIDLKRAYGEQGYGFPLERFLGTWPDRSPKRHGIVLFVRPFAALMAHILGILHEMETNGFVHGDFHPGNLIAVPSFSDRGEAVPPNTTVWTWKGVYDKSSDKNRSGVNNDKTLQFSNLPLYAPVAAQAPTRQLSYPSNVMYPPINGVNPGQYLQFRAIDLGFGYQVLEKMAQTFNITSKTKKEVLDPMWTADKEISVFPSVFHPWFDKFRLGLYLAKSVLYSAKLATTGVFDKETQKFLPVINFSKGSNPTWMKLKLIILMMNSHPANSQAFNGEGMQPKESVRGLYNEVVHDDYLGKNLSSKQLSDRIIAMGQDLLTTMRFSIEMIAMALKLTTLPEHWKAHANALLNSNAKSVNFLPCHGAINLLRHFLLTVIDLYTKFKVVAKDQNDRDRGVSVVPKVGETLDLADYPQFTNLVDIKYIASVEKAFGQINQNFTPALSELIRMDSTFPKDYMSFNHVFYDSALWEAIV